MKIIIAPDSYKGSCSAAVVADNLEKGIRKVFPKAEIVKIPVADGGEGTVDAMVLACGGQFKKVSVTGPLGNKVNAKYGLLDKGVAVIEMAEASGLVLVPEGKRNPLVTTTYGIGELIKSALDDGCKKIIVGIGGSATNDGGLGMAQALGVTFRDKNGWELGFGGGEIEKLNLIDVSSIDPRIPETEIIVACDVSNPLCGEKGASAVYGPQKGATPEMVAKLDYNLMHFARLIKEQVGNDVTEIPGTGAAGGLGAGLIAFCGAKIRPGIETILDITNIDRHLSDATLVITGEGKIDGQTVYGKVPVGVAKRAKKYNVPVTAIVGSIGEGAYKVYDHGVDGIISIIDKPMVLYEAMAKSGELIESAIERVMRIMKVGMAINE